MTKVLIFSHVSTWISHHAEAVELALRENDRGNQVYFLSCTGDLAICPANVRKIELICTICRTQTQRTTTKLLPKEIKSIDLSVKGLQWDDLEFNSIDELKQFQQGGVPYGNMVYSTYTSMLNDSFFDTVKHSKRINQLLKNAVGLYEAVTDLVKNEGIDKVYAWNGRRSCDGPAVYAADNLGKEFSTFISGGRYNSILVRDGRYTVHDVPSAREELARIVDDIEDNKNGFSIGRDAVNFFDYAGGGRSSKMLNYLGYYQFSQIFDSKEQRYEWLRDNGKIKIAIFTGTYSEFAGVPGYDDAAAFCKNFYEGVSFLQENVEKIENADLIVRWHPNSRNLKGREKSRLDDIIEKGREIENVFHIAPESNFNTYELIENCDLAVGFGTSVAVESCLYGKPAIFIGNNMFEGLNCFYKPTSWAEFVELLNAELKVKDFNHALAWGYYFSNSGNVDFEKLTQKKSKVFYLGKKRMTSWPLTVRHFLGRLRSFYRSLNFV